uniref:F-box domain-containing protein n=1 Tax=Caenorhabditis tropicalis TaxID=1561998 RepID=A0A1I7TKX5_9PELO
MTFPLLKLPSLAYEQVLLNFEISDLVDFSLLSSRCHRIIQSIRFPFTGIGVNVADNMNSLRFFTGIWTKDQWTFQLIPTKKSPEKPDEQRWIGGMRIRVKKTPNWSSNRTPENQLKVAYDYVQHLFHLPIADYNYLSRTNQKLFPQLFGIKTCEKMCLSTPSEIPVDELKYVLQKVEISKVLRMNLMKNDDFECEFVKFSMDELKIFRAFWITNETFLAMDCARIVLEGNGNLPIRKFVSQWLLSKNNRFEWLKMNWNYGENWNYEEINWNEGFKPMIWNPAIRSRNFKISHFQRVDCAKGIDFLREDGLLATVLQRNNQIYFVIWHKRFQPEADRLQLDHIF